MKLGGKWGRDKRGTGVEGMRCELDQNNICKHKILN